MEFLSGVYILSHVLFTCLQTSNIPIINFQHSIYMFICVLDHSIANTSVTILQLTSPEWIQCKHSGRHAEDQLLKYMVHNER